MKGVCLLNNVNHVKSFFRAVLHLLELDLSENITPNLFYVIFVEKQLREIVNGLCNYAEGYYSTTA